MTKTLSFVFAAMLAASASAQNVTSNRYDNVRSAATTGETTLTPANVNSAQFGKLCTYSAAPADGSPADQYAQPLIVRNVSIPGRGVHDVVYTATQANDVFAFDANCLTSTPLWQVNLGTPVPTSETPIGGDTSIRPGAVGVMGTPAIDASTGTIYVMARTRLAVGVHTYKLHALDIATGAEKLGGPVTVAAAVPGTGVDHTANNMIVFNPRTHNHRAGLALACGKVYAAWTSYADMDDYHGWVIAYDAATLAQVGVFNASPNGEMSSIWQSGGAPAIDSSCNVYVATSNGSNNGTTDFSESLLKLSPTLTLLDWYRPSNGDNLDVADGDFGVSPTTLIPGIDAIIQGGKAAQYYVVRMSNLGHVVAGDTQLRQLLPVEGGQLRGQAVWTSAAGPRLYNWGSGGRLTSYTWNGQGFAQTSQASTAGSGGSLSVSSNGLSSAILWSCMAYNASAWHNVVNGICRAYDANDLAQELWNSKQVPSRDEVGNYAKFVMPVVNNGKLYVATFSNLLHVYGLLPPDPVTYQVSGVVTYNGAPVSGVSFDITNQGACTVSDATGNYACTVNSGWGGTITPTKPGFALTPISRTYSNVQASLNSENYAAGPTTATFIATDLITQGNWQGNYGRDGYEVIGDSASYPSYVTAAPRNKNDCVWAAHPDTDVRALQRATSGRIAACWTAPSTFDVNLSFTDTAVHRVALYFLDWDTGLRNVRVDIIDTASQQVLSTRTAQSFNAGAYLVWNLQGRLTVRLTRQAGANAVLSGLFFDAPSGPLPSVTTLSSNTNPAVVGSSVLFTATVHGSSPTGNVSFTDGGTPICTAVALTGTGSTRTATCGTAGLAVGVHSIAAAYSGDANNLSSQSAALSQSIIAGQTLTVTKSGTGAGTVTADSGAINCGPICSDIYPGTAVTLTATPALGSVFVRWEGACTGGGACRVTMDAARTVNAVFDLAPPVLASAASRRVHGTAGTFSLPLSLLATNPTTEPRQGPAHTIVFTFDKAVTAGVATVTEGTATAGTPTFSGNAMVVPLTGVANQGYVTVAVGNVNAADGSTGGSGSVRVGFLLGDVNQNRVVTLSDLGQVNAQVAQLVTAANYLKDVNVSGTLSLADKGIANAQLTRALPAP